MPASPQLVTLAEVKEYLGIASGDTSQDGLLGPLAARVEALLRRAKNRTFAPASSAQTVTANGTGRPYLYLDRPAAALTSVAIGEDPSSPSETLAPGPTTVVIDPESPRRLVRQDGGVFPAGVANVRVVCDLASSAYEDARQAVFEGVAFLYRSRGSEDASSESTGGFSHTMRTSFDQLPSWAAIPRRPALA